MWPVKTHHSYSKGFLLEELEKGNQGKNWPTQVHLENGH